MAKAADAPKALKVPPTLYGRVREILDAARTGIARTVNTTQVMANWLIGREIVEEEQRGRRRAGYGTALLGELAERLRAEFGRGYGVDNLELFRRFYLDYPELLGVVSAAAEPGAISDAPRRKSGVLAAALLNPAAVKADAWQPGRLNPNLSWTHYRRLLRVDRADARAFYELEAARNAWSARELERQVASLLFDRLAKSRDSAFRNLILSRIMSVFSRVRLEKRISFSRSMASSSVWGKVPLALNKST